MAMWIESLLFWGSGHFIDLSLIDWNFDNHSWKRMWTLSSSIQQGGLASFGKWRVVKSNLSAVATWRVSRYLHLS